MLNETAIRGDHLHPYLRNVDVQWNHINLSDLPQMDIGPWEIARFTVVRGDLLVCEGGEVGRAALVQDAAHGLGYQKALHRLRPLAAGEDPRFMFYTLHGAAQRGVFVAGGNPNTIAHLTGEKLGRYRFPAPFGFEQRAIADFLDLETAKIDTLVAKKRTLIERLHEKRTTLISRTVTRGLPPNAARQADLDPHPKPKPTGIDWLGDVPEHWEMKQLMQLTDQARPIMYGIVLPGPDVPDGVPIVKGGDVKPGRLTLGSLCRTTVEIEAGYIRSRLATGDIVFSIRGTVGEAELVPKEITGANLTQDAARVAPSSATHGPWLLFALKAKAITNPILSLSLGAAVRGVNIRDLKRIALVVPPLSEQRAIADFLDRETAKIDTMVTKIETAIERLQEYRTALITSAVTGKIDVRKAAA